MERGQLDADQIVAELERRRNKIQTSFIVDTTEFMNRSGRLSNIVHKMCVALMLHPVIVMRDYAMHVEGFVIGNQEQARSSYIRRVLSNKERIDTSVLFITYVGMRIQEAEKVRKEALSIVHFDKVILQKASPAVSINGGPGTFGLIFSRK